MFPTCKSSNVLLWWELKLLRSVKTFLDMCLLPGLCKVIWLEEKTQNFLTLRWIFCRFHPRRRRVSNFPVLIRNSNLFAFIWVNYFQRRCFWEYIGLKNRVMDVWRLPRTVWSRIWVWVISFFDRSRFSCITSDLFYVNPTWMW